MHHFAQRLVNGMIVDAGELEGDADVGAELRKLTAHVLLYLMQAVHFLFIGAEELLVHFVDENLVSYALFQLMRRNDQVPEPYAGVFVILRLRIDHIHERPTVTHQCRRICF